ncbi:hypothetical protein [Acinetobacter bereziniae]|nr:hypothetical protein [Acinetobacter bereziniae]MBI0393352.1 hypothetical protein [Acinetobacter bereziniae]
MAQNNDAGKGLLRLKWSWKKRKRITNQRLDKFGVVLLLLNILKICSP